MAAGHDPQPQTQLTAERDTGPDEDHRDIYPIRHGGSGASLP